MHICCGSFVGSLWRETKEAGSEFSLYHFAIFLLRPQLYFPAGLLLSVPSSSFCSSLTAFSLLFALMLIFGVAPFVPSSLLFLPHAFSLSLQCSFSLLSSARFPALAFTGGYSSLGWAETASLYNTDRLLCNQIPSVATSEESLPRFLHHTHAHACRHTCTQAPTQTQTHTLHLWIPLFNVCVCVVVMCTDGGSQPG